MGDFTWCVKRGLDRQKVALFALFLFLVLFLPLPLEPFAEVFQALTEGGTDLGEAAGAEYDQDHHKKQD